MQRVFELAFSVVAKDAILQIPKWFVENVVLSNVDLDRNPEYKREVILTKKGEILVFKGNARFRARLLKLIDGYLF